MNVVIIFTDNLIPVIFLSGHLLLKYVMVNLHCQVDGI